jgi:hypothetical protein
LFQKVIYDRRSDSADEAIVQLKQLLPTLNHYIATEIVVCLTDCSEVYRGQVFTLGINHTSATESANKMIRSSPRSPHFITIRAAHSRTHELKSAALQAKVVRQFQTTHFLRAVHGLQLSRPILKRIDLCIARSHAWAIQKSHDRAHAYRAWRKEKERC